MYQVTFRYNGTETEWIAPLKAAQVMATMRESRAIDPSATFKFTKIADLTAGRELVVGCENGFSTSGHCD
jgi:hypothetical protein